MTSTTTDTTVRILVSMPEESEHKASLFDHVPSGPLDPMNDLTLRLNSDTAPGKIDLGAGVYRGEDGTYFELPSISKVSIHYLIM